MSYALWAPTMIIPLIGAVLFDVMSKRAAISAIVLGGATTALWNWGPFPLQELTGFTPLLAGVSVNLIVFVLLAMTDKKVISINTVLGSKSRFCTQRLSTLLALYVLLLLYILGLLVSSFI